MITARFIKVACVAGLAAACVCGSAACSSSTTSGLTGGVAATVNGVEISEDEVTTTIQNLRTSYGLEDQDTWGNYLAQMGMTPEELRTNVIESFEDEELQKQGAEERGVTVDQADIDAVVEQIKANYDSEDKWNQALEQAGFADEADYRENVNDGLLREALLESFTAEDPTDEEIVEYASTAITFDVAKRSSHILFDPNDQETAQSVLDQINAGEIDFATAAQEYSTDTGSAQDGGDVGWDQLTTFVDEYQTALDGLSVGQVSELVESDYGWHIITCTDEFVPPDEITSIDQLPQEFVDSYRDSLSQEKQQEAYQTWFEEYKESADIVVNDPPEGLPYMVDMSQYQTEDTSEDATEGESTDESAGSAEGDATADASAEGESAEDSTADASASSEGESTDAETSGESSAEAA